MQRYLKTEAIVLKKKQILNKDMMIVFFTREEGKVFAVAKGVRNIVSKRLPSLMTGNLVYLHLSMYKDRYYLHEASIISLFSRIKKHAHLQKYLYLYLYLLDQMLSERQRELTIYNQLKKFLVELSKDDFSEKKMTGYCRVLLDYFGYGNKPETMPDIIRKIEEIIGKKIPPFII
ncbi:MAG: DNA repair protein RecO [Patescibacteria group bacterium]